MVVILYKELLQLFLPLNVNRSHRNISGFLCCAAAWLNGLAAPRAVHTSAAPEALCLMEALHEVHFVQGRLSGHPLLIAVPLFVFNLFLCTSKSST